ncbi:MAG: BACON domain-containing carbohydrate-binding protein [Bacteroidetes bacterium]|nr:BACON domain-containing carbohydrate-binding protein [Bacteroidota bacterium]
MKKIYSFFLFLACSCVVFSQSVFTNDAGIIQLVKPVSGPLPGNTVIKVRIVNAGTSPASNFSVSYRVNNQNPVTETMVNVLDPGESYDLPFSQTADLSVPGIYEIKCYTGLVYDEDHTNDTLVQIVNSVVSGAISEATIGTTHYDLQSNNSPQNRIFAYNDGTIGATWTYGVIINSFTDRGTGYNYYNGTGWGASPTQRIENVRTGWPSYQALSTTGEVVVSHLGTTAGLKISKRTIKGTGPWVYSTLVGPVSSPELMWPRMVTSGTTHDTIHVMSITAPLANSGTLYHGQDGSLMYNRSVNGGLSWDISNYQLPESDTNFYYGMTSDCYAMADPKGNTLAFVVGDNWKDVMLFKSTDAGVTWTKQLVFQHPYPKYRESTTLVLDTPTVCDGSLAIQLDNNGKAHVFFGLMRVLNSDITDGVISYFPNTQGLAYWNEDMPTLTDLSFNHLSNSGNLIGWLQDLNGNGIVMEYTGFGLYFDSFTSMPSATIDEFNNIYLVFSSLMENLDNGSQNYRHIWGRARVNGQWGDFVNLNNSIIHNFHECVFPSVTSRPGDNYLHMIYQSDEEPGLAIRGDNDPYTDNSIIYTKIPKVNFGVLTPSLQVNPSNPSISNTPGNVLINITANLPWTVSENSDWLSVQPGYGTNNGSFTVSYDQNTGIERTAIITVNGPGGNPSQIVTITQPAGNAAMLSGILSYDNTLNSPLNNTSVILKQNNSPFADTTTGSDGSFLFQLLSSGQYTLDAQCSKTWGGANANDALLVLRKFTGLVTLSPLRSAAADVDASGFSNAADALMIARRFVGIIPSFPAGDWVFEHPDIVLPQSGNVIWNFMGLCFGDLDGSYIPPVKQEPGVMLTFEENIQGCPGETILVPVGTCSDLEIGSISLLLEYPGKSIEILDVEIPGNPGNLVYNARDGRLSVAWYSLDALHLKKGETLLQIRLRLLTQDRNVIQFSTLPGCELGNADASPLEKVKLSVPVLLPVETTELLKGIFPNPFINSTLITYSLPEEGEACLVICNLLGEVLETLQDVPLPKGNYEFLWTPRPATSGMVFCKLSFNGKTIHKTCVKPLIINQ